MDRRELLRRGALAGAFAVFGVWPDQSGKGNHAICPQQIAKAEEIPQTAASMMVYVTGQDWGVEYAQWANPLTDERVQRLCEYVHDKWGDKAIVSFAHGEQDWVARKSWPVARLISGPGQRVFGDMIAFWKTSPPEAKC